MWFKFTILVYRTGAFSMNFENLGNLGDLIGAFAVVITLIYLAIQMRQNTAAVRATALLEIQRDVRSILTTDQETAELLVRSIDDEELSVGEQSRVVLRYMLIFRTFESIWFQAEKEALEKQLLEGYMHHLRIIMSASLAKAIWNDYQQNVFHPGFVRYVNNYIENNPPKRPFQQNKEVASS